MSDPSNPFELEPEDDREGGDPAGPASKPKPKPDAGGTPAGPGGFDLEDETEAPKIAQDGPLPEPAAPPPAAPAPRAREGSEEGVDTRTVAERAGATTPRMTEALGNPVDWPREILTFPLEKPGPQFLALATGALLALDLVGTIEAVRFPAWVAKLVLLVFLLRAQFYVIGSSAAGKDAPTGWSKALEFAVSDARQYGATLAMFAGLLAPGIVLWAFDKLGPSLLLLLLGSMYAAVVAMGAAFQEPSLKYPWNALKWMGTRPLHCLAGSLAWWALLATELALFAMRDQSTGLIGFVALALRLLCTYMLLLSARAIGVMGRAWRVT